MGLLKTDKEMAKWGEGDPRWIVEERPDATNVNNWHWTEKNADAWSKSKIKELFENHVIEVPSVGNVILEEVEKCEGEARANNRKGKLIFFYEWEIAVKWKGHANGKDTEVTGKIEIPNLSEEHEDMEDVEERPRGKEGPRAALQLCAGFEKRVQQRVDLAKEGPSCCSCQDFCCCETCQQVCWWASK